MSPFDAQTLHMTDTLVSPAAAVVLPGGRVALTITHSNAPLPTRGTVDGSGEWTALMWRTDKGCAGLALLPAMPEHDAHLRDGKGNIVARVARPNHLDITATPLLGLVGNSRDNAGALLEFLQTHLNAVAPSLIADFLAGGAERDGFVEIAARTECGGLYLQGWSQSLQPGFTQVMGLTEGEPYEVAVARFERDDILAPASGIALYAKCIDEADPIPTALYFQNEGRLCRLDVVQTMPEPLAGEQATGHVRAMIGRMNAPRNTLGAFRRICRPRYEGEDTLSAYHGPIAAAFDRVLRAGDGTLLVSGWLLDPLAQVEHVILKSRANLYAPLHKTWNLLPRPDLNKAFAENPAFADLLDDREIMHGFIAHATAKPEETQSDVYLEIVLEDGSCLFRPVEVTPGQGDGLLHAVLGGLSPDEPELPQIVEGHLAPFLAGLARRAKPLRQIARPSPLGSGPAGREVNAVMPVSGLDELQPVLAALAGTEDAASLDLTLVAGRQTGARIRQDLDDAFRFYGLTGQMVIVPDHATLSARLDAGIAASTATRVLVWHPSVLPKGPGWLATLCADADSNNAGLASPMLTYEDGSVYFGGARPARANGEASCAHVGFGATMARETFATPVSAGAAEIALIDRDILKEAGGISGHLFGDTFTHLDLARRLRKAGGRAVFSPSAEFWMLEDPKPQDNSPITQMTRAVDAALIARHLSEESLR